MPAAGAGAHPPLAQHVGRQEGSPDDAKPSGAGAAPALRTYSRKRGRRTPRGELLRDVRAGDAAQRPRSPLLTWLQGGAGVAPAEGGEPRAERGGGDVPRGPDGECESGPSGVCRESGGAAPAEQDAQRGGSACAARGAHGGGCRAAGAAEGSPSPRAASPDPGGAGAPRDSSGLPGGGDGSPAPLGLIRREGGGRAPAHLRFSSESPEAGAGPPAEGPSAAVVPCPAPAQARAAPGVLLGRVVAYSVTPEPSDAGDPEPDPDPDPPVAAAERASPAAAAGRPNLWERGRQAVSSFAAVIAGGRHAGDGRCGGEGADAGHAAAPDAGLPGEQASGGATAAAPGPVPARSLAAGGGRGPQQGGAGPAGATAPAPGGHVAPQLSQASAQFRRNVAAHAGCGKVRTPQYQPQACQQALAPLNRLQKTPLLNVVTFSCKGHFGARIHTYCCLQEEAMPELGASSQPGDLMGKRLSLVHGSFSKASRCSLAGMCIQCKEPAAALAGAEWALGALDAQRKRSKAAAAEAAHRDERGTAAPGAHYINPNPSPRLRNCAPQQRTAAAPRSSLCPFWPARHAPAALCPASCSPRTACAAAHMLLSRTGASRGRRVPPAHVQRRR